MVRGAVGAAAFALAGCLLLGGCTGAAETPGGTSRPVTASTPSPSASAITLGEARALYERYVRVSDEVSADGGRDVNRLRQFVTANQFVKEKRAFAAFQHAARHTVGETKLSAVRLQQSSERNASAYVCMRLERLRIIDAQGRDVTPSTRPNEQTFVVTFERSSNRLVVGGIQPWSGSSVCA